MKPIFLSNQTVGRVQDALASLPRLKSSRYQSSRPFGPDRYVKETIKVPSPDILNEAKRLLGQAAKGQSVEAHLATIEPLVESVEGGKRLRTIWACLFRYESDFPELSRLIPSSVSPNALAVSGFGLNCQTAKPGVIAVHQSMPQVATPRLRSFIRLAGLMETTEGSLGQILGGQYFEARLLQDRDEEPFGILEAAEGVRVFFGRQADQLRDEAKKKPVTELPLKTRTKRKLAAANPPITRVGELREMLLEELQERIRNLSEDDITDIREALKSYGFDGVL